MKQSREEREMIKELLKNAKKVVGQETEEIHNEIPEELSIDISNDLLEELGIINKNSNKEKSK